MSRFIWTGPFKIRCLLENCLERDQPWPPPSEAVYVVSRVKWRTAPGRNCRPLYIGSNTGKSERFCTRIGDLIADMYGLWDGDTGHHSGGQTLYEWCEQNVIHPGDLFIGWGTRKPWCGCCAEIEVVESLLGKWSNRKSVGLLNKKRPPTCRVHDKGISD